MHYRQNPTEQYCVLYYFIVMHALHIVLLESYCTQSPMSCWLSHTAHPAVLLLHDYFHNHMELYFKRIYGK
jgi:hypothetical protein